MIVSHECAPVCDVAHANPPLPVSAFPDMEDAIKKIVTTFVTTSRGKGDLDSKSFRKLVSSNLGNTMEVRIIMRGFFLCCLRVTCLVLCAAGYRQRLCH